MTIIWVKFGSYEANKNIHKKKKKEQEEQTLFQITFKMESTSLKIKPHPKISCDLENVPTVTKNYTIVYSS